MGRSLFFRMDLRYKVEHVVVVFMVTQNKAFKFLDKQMLSHKVVLINVKNSTSSTNDVLMNK